MKSYIRDRKTTGKQASGENRSRLSETDGNDNERNVPEFKPWNQYSPQVMGRARDKWRQLVAEHRHCIDQTEIWQHGVANSRQ